MKRPAIAPLRDSTAKFPEKFAVSNDLSTLSDYMTYAESAILSLGKLFAIEIYGRTQVFRKI
jgi:hypothetical protein